MSRNLDQSKCHLNTVYIRPQSRMTQGPYQSLKNQIALQNFFNPNFTEKNKQDEMKQTIDELKKLMKGQKDIDKEKINRINAIKLAPVVNENFISSFDQNEYDLSNQDKVKIVKQKVFRVQNYYNYLYQLKTKQQYEKLNNKVQMFLRSSKYDKKDESNEEKSRNEGQKDDDFLKFQQRKGRSNIEDNINESRWKGSGYNESFGQGTMMKGSLAPQYRKYEQRKVDSQRHFLKQSEKRKIQEKYGQ